MPIIKIENEENSQEDLYIITEKVIGFTTSKSEGENRIIVYFNGEADPWHVSVSPETFINLLGSI